MQIILASASPRRKELMQMLQVPNLRILPAKGEEIPPDGAGPEELVKALSEAKVREIAPQCGEDDVIELVPVEGADHPFRNPKLMDTAIHTIVEFFSE